MSRAEYIREWRQGNDRARERQTRAERARRKALQELAEKYEWEFTDLLNKHRHDEGLPPL